MARSYEIVTLSVSEESMFYVGAQFVESSLYGKQINPNDLGLKEEAP